MAPPENREIGIDRENSDDDSPEVVNLASGSLHKCKSKGWAVGDEDAACEDRTKS